MKSRKKKRITNDLNELKTSYNINATTYMKEDKQEVANIVQEDESYFVHILDEEPITFKEAWYHQDKDIRRKWREAMIKEIYCMHDKVV